MTVQRTRPSYLAGHLAPVPDEIDAVDLPVAGALPRELTGRYLRNGPNPLPGEDPGHWFGGHGMVHGIRLHGGRAEWYRNRWVRTGALAGRPRQRPDGRPDRAAVTGNTHVLPHAGRIFALVENGLPHVLTPELDTVGPCDFAGRLTTAMTAHPKADPVSGDLHFFGYSPVAPHLTYHRLSAVGELVASAEVPGAGPSMMHDFAITERYAVFLDLPITFRPQLLGRGMPYAWDDGYPARLGVMPLAEPGSVRWIAVDPCYVFHVGNAYEDAAGRIVLDAVRYTPADTVAMWAGIGGTVPGPVTTGPGRAAPGGAPAGPGGAAAGPVAAAGATGAARLHRWLIDPTAGTAREEVRDDRGIEFPTLDDRRTGRPARYLYAVEDAGERAAVLRYDTGTGAVTGHELGPDVVAGEAVFVPAAAGEDAGWLLTVTSRRDGGASRLLVLDASGVDGDPVAAVTLPRGVPAGFHGSWIDDTEIFSDPTPTRLEQ